MTQEAAMPDPVDLYQLSIDRAKEVVAHIKQEQIDAPTPCTEWNVHAVINHLIGGAELTTAGLLGNAFEFAPGTTESSYIAEIDADKLSKAYQTESDAVLAAAGRPGALERVVPTRFGDMPMAQFLMAIATDQFIHTWDLAKATGQDSTLDPGLVAVVYPMLRSGFAEMGRNGGFIGPEVPVPDTAGLQEKMLGYMGRQPW